MTTLYDRAKARLVKALGGSMRGESWEGPGSEYADTGYGASPAAPIHGSTRGFGGTSPFDASSPFSYEPSITAQQLFNPSSVTDRDGMALRHPWAYKLCYQVPEFIWSHPLGVLDSNGDAVVELPETPAEGEDKPMRGEAFEPKGQEEEETSEELQVTDAKGNSIVEGLNKLEKIHYRDALITATQGDFKHGWSVLVLWQENEKKWSTLKTAPAWRNPDADFMQRVPGLKSIDRIDWLTPTVINKGKKMPADLFDTEGWPKAYRYYFTPTEFVDIDAKRCVLVRSRAHGRASAGIPLLVPVWDTLVYSYALFSSFGWATAKYGQTSVAVPTMGNQSDTQAGQTETAMQAWHKKSVLLYDAMAGKEPKMIQPEHMDPGPLVNMWMTNMAVGSGFPKLWFEGEKVGAVTGSEIDTRNTTARIKQLETQLESPVWRLLAVLDESVLEDASDYRLEFPHEEQISEIERAAWWSSVLSQAQNALSAMSMNEYRRNVLNMGNIDGGDITPTERSEQQFDQAKEMTEASGRSMEFGKGAGKPSKGKVKGESRYDRDTMKGVQLPPSYADLEDAYKLYGSTRKVCRYLRCSHNTIAKQRVRQQEETRKDATF